MFDRNWTKIAYFSQKSIFWNYFYLFIVLYHAANFEKYPWTEYWAIALDHFEPQLGQNCLDLIQNMIFWANLI